MKFNQFDAQGNFLGSMTFESEKSSVLSEGINLLGKALGAAALGACTFLGQELYVKVISPLIFKKENTAKEEPAN